MSKFDHQSSGRVYGAFAFASVIVTCFGGYVFTTRFYGPAWLVPVTFALGGVYALVGVLGGGCIGGPGRAGQTLYFLGQITLLTVMVFLSPLRGFFGIIVLPVISQAIFDLPKRTAALVATYLFLMSIAVWGVDYGWMAAAEAGVSYAAAFAFTIVFTYISKQALDTRDRAQRLSAELETANAQLRAHAAQTEELATTRERNRVAREIHDGVGHYLTVVKTQLDAAAALITTQPDQAREAITTAAKLAAEALDDVRRSVGTLRTDITRPPLPQALQNLVSVGDPTPVLSITGQPRPLSTGIEHALFRAAQEGLTNIRKHARATSSWLQLDFRSPQHIVLELSDNGRGATPGDESDGFGLRGLRERIELLGGTVVAANRLEGGFALRVEVPA